MSWGKVSSVVISVIFSTVALAVGKIWGNSEGEEKQRKMNEENEELRRQLRSILEILKAELAKKNEKITWLEYLIEQLMTSPPANADQLRERLRLLNLTKDQIEMVMERANNIYGIVKK